LAPETGPDQGGEWNHGGDHQGQKTRSNAPQHPHSPADWNLLPTLRLSKNRLLPSHPRLPDATAIARPAGLVAKPPARRNCLAEDRSGKVASSGEMPDLFDHDE
jgi:hypothetical protein